MKALVVDDSLLIRKQIKDFLTNTLKFDEVITGEDGEEAVELYEEEKPDLVTLDITMPNKSGLDALSEIMDMDPNAKVLMISALSEDDKIMEALDGGAKGFISKPLKMMEKEFLSDFEEEVKNALK